jgi:hypothetical protein
VKLVLEELDEEECPWLEEGRGLKVQALWAMAWAWDVVRV